MGVGDVNKHREIGKYISILQRLSNIYFANELSSYQIGCGQQFFLLQIFKNPGISLQELASNGSFDKATATRAVKKLEEEAYVRTEPMVRTSVSATFTRRKRRKRLWT